MDYRGLSVEKLCFFTFLQNVSNNFIHSLYDCRVQWSRSFEPDRHFKKIHQRGLVKGLKKE